MRSPLLATSSATATGLDAVTSATLSSTFGAASTVFAVAGFAFKIALTSVPSGPITANSASTGEDSPSCIPI